MLLDTCILNFQLVDLHIKENEKPVTQNINNCEQFTKLEFAL